MNRQPVAIVTGSSAGIGKETAKLLVAAGWRVIGTGRDPERSAAAVAEVQSTCADGGSFTLLRGDFCDMADVSRVAGEIKALTDRVDVLINNAGGVRDARYVGKEGLEAMFAANHAAPFLLTRELMPLLEAAAADRPAGSVRVIAVSSLAHEYCPGMNWDDLNFENNFSTGAAYCQAKLANILFARALDRRVAAKGIASQAMHPGRVASNFASHGDAQMRHHFDANGTLTPDQPARTLFWLATSDEAGLPGGRYFHECAEAPTAAQALDDTAAERLWTETEAILRKIGF